MHPPFVHFLEVFFGLRLSVGQRALLRVTVDGAEPKDLEGAEREAAALMFGPSVETIPPAARAVLAIVGGARWGKTYLPGALYSLWRALFADLSTLAPGELAVALAVARDMRLGRILLRFAVGAAQSHPHLRGCIRRVHADAVELVRPDKQPVSIEVLPASAGGAALRGRSLVSAVLDEAAFFRDENYAVNDADIFKAVAPRVLPGGLVVVQGTPWAEAGLLFDLFTANHDHPRTAIAAHCPTLLMLPTERNQQVVARERERDPDNAAREFEAEFMPAGSGLLLDPAALRDATDATLPVRLPPVKTRAVAGFDFGPTRDATGGVVLRIGPDGRIESAETFERKPVKGTPLVPSQVVREFCEVAKAHGAREVWADAFYREAIAEHVRANGLTFVPAPAGNAGNVLQAGVVRELVHGGRVVIPAAQRELVRQLGELALRPMSGGAFKLHSPRRPGSHGDVARAFLLAAYALHTRSRCSGKWEVHTSSALRDEGGY